MFHARVSLLVAFLLAAWPAPDATLTVLPAPAPLQRKLKVYVDAGHGSVGNEGAPGCFCQREQVHTAAVAMHLAYVLARLGAFEVKLSRKEGLGARYPSRITEAERWGADAIVSVHADVRGEAWAWSVDDDGQTCWRNDGATGFAVLWSEDGEQAMVDRRAKLGRAVSRRLSEAGFERYGGEDYGALYKADEDSLGWIDIRPRKKSVYFLRASSKVPTVIVETHQALAPAEVQRWDETATVDAFALAVANALVDAARTP